MIARKTSPTLILSYQRRRKHQIPLLSLTRLEGGSEHVDLISPFIKNAETNGTSPCLTCLELVILILAFGNVS